MLNNLTFESNFKALATRYGGGTWAIIAMPLYLILRSFTDERLDVMGFLSIVFSDIRGPLFYLCIALFVHICFYLASYGYTKRLIISDSSINFYLFRFFGYKNTKLKYSDIETIETEHGNEIFIFHFKNGKTKKIYATVKNKEKALEEIKKRI
jgi:hypothetical protein